MTDSLAPHIDPCRCCCVARVAIKMSSLGSRFFMACNVAYFHSSSFKSKSGGIFALIGRFKYGRPDQRGDRLRAARTSNRETGTGYRVPGTGTPPGTGVHDSVCGIFTVAASHAHSLNSFFFCIYFFYFSYFPYFFALFFASSY